MEKTYKCLTMLVALSSAIFLVWLAVDIHFLLSLPFISITSLAVALCLEKKYPMVKLSLVTLSLVAIIALVVLFNTSLETLIRL